MLPLFVAPGFNGFNDDCFTVNGRRSKKVWKTFDFCDRFLRIIIEFIILFVNSFVQYLYPF